VDITTVAGKVAKAWWFSPRTGKSNAAGEFPTAGKRQITPPAEGEWVLVLDDASRNRSAPGQSWQANDLEIVGDPRGQSMVNHPRDSEAARPCSEPAT